MALVSNSPATVAQALKGIDFPASKKEMIAYAKKNDADEHTITLMEGMPDEEYTSMADVFKGVGIANE